MIGALVPRRLIVRTIPTLESRKRGRGSRYQSPALPSMASRPIPLAEKTTKSFPHRMAESFVYSAIPPMADSLRSHLADLADSFATAVLSAIRSASLEELLAESGGPRRGAPRSAAGARSAPRSPRGSSPGRLPRRSADDIAHVLDSVTSLVKKHKEGLRAEQIREELGLQAKELPRVLKEGLSSRKLKSKGQKRATTYFAT
jgi:hypothetical protein